MPRPRPESAVLHRRPRPARARAVPAPLPGPPQAAPRPNPMPGPPHGQTHPVGTLPTAAGACAWSFSRSCWSFLVSSSIFAWSGFSADWASIKSAIVRWILARSPAFADALAFASTFLSSGDLVAFVSSAKPRETRLHQNAAIVTKVSTCLMVNSFRTFTQRSAPCKFCTPVRAYPTHSCNGWWAVCGSRIRKIGPKARKPPDPTPQDAFLAWIVAVARPWPWVGHHANNATSMPILPCNGVWKKWSKKKPALMQNGPDSRYRFGQQRRWGCQRAKVWE